MSFSKSVKEELLKQEIVKTNIPKKINNSKLFIKQQFLLCGYISNPEKSYHLEFIYSDENLANDLIRNLAINKIEAKKTIRKNLIVVYIKEYEKIIGVLNLIGAVLSQLKYENFWVEKDVNNNINRRVNFGSANINKTIDASVSQTEDIQLIKKTVGLSFLKKELRETAEIRLENSDATLLEISKLLDPPVSKSCVNHRFKKISTIANDLKNR